MQFDKPIIFLDYDGVVNIRLWGNYSTQKNGKFCPSFANAADGYVNNYQGICWLNLMYEKCPYDIVVSSKAWRDEPNYKECLYNGGLNRIIKIIGTTKDVYKNQEYSRGNEIKNWIQENNYNGPFAIIDDNSDIDDLKKFLVLCNSRVGFDGLDMEKTLKLIKR